MLNVQSADRAVIARRRPVYNITAWTTVDVIPADLLSVNLLRIGRDHPLDSVRAPATTDYA